LVCDIFDDLSRHINHAITPLDDIAIIDEAGGLKQFLIISEKTIKLVGVDDRSEINELCTSRTRTLCPGDRQTKIRKGSNFRNPRHRNTSVLELSRAHGAFSAPLAAAPCCWAQMPNFASRRTERNDLASPHPSG